MGRRDMCLYLEHSGSRNGGGGRIAIHCHPGLVNQSPTEPHKGILALETKLGILLLIKHMQGPEFDP
jgi:hypothetical protein